MADMTDAELIGYCEIHCDTPVGLFSPQHINRMLALAGHPEGYVRSVDRWLSLGSEMQHLCDLARARLPAQEPGAQQGQSSAREGAERSEA